VVEPPAALIEAINKSNARYLRFLGGRHSMSMMTNTLGRYFAGRFVGLGSGRVRQHLRASVLVGLHRDGQEKTSGLASLSGHRGCGDLRCYRVPHCSRKMNAIFAS
jgi:hypothetical protein